MVLTLLLCLQVLGRFLWEVATLVCGRVWVPWEVNTCAGSAVRGTGWPVSCVLV